MGLYALGMAAPLFALAGLWQRFDIGRRTWLRGRELRLGRLRLHTTSTISGLLFIAVGAVFLLFGGGGLLTDDVGLALGIEDAVAALGARVPDAVFLLILAATVVVIATWRLRRAPPHPRGDVEPEQAGSADRIMIATSPRIDPALPKGGQPDHDRFEGGSVHPRPLGVPDNEHLG